MAEKTFVTDEEVRVAVRRTVSEKGGRYDELWFTQTRFQNRDYLERSGATPEQLTLYDGLVDAAPTIGGCFNHWSGE